MREGKAYEEIVKYAKSQHNDLIVMDTIGLTGFERLLMGSTAEAVVSLAPCPVSSLEKIGQPNTAMNPIILIRFIAFRTMQMKFQCLI